MVVSQAARAAAVSAAFVALAGPAWAGTPALVVDVATGRVIHAERATDPWYPASVTKLMTTYVALDLVREGRASMNQLLTLSAEAAAQPPSKMGLKPGTQITLENALKIIMVKSANDLAMMIGENLGGSVDGFAVMMNEAARRLGMRESRWYNPNGLPDERQQTSARDMAILARALLRDFPEHDALFRIGAVQLGRNIMRNHNGMLGRYPGADGMKTGFICAGGFNIVSSATQNGRRVIAVVFGYPSARERDLRTADLLDEGFASSGGGWGGQRLEDLPPSNAIAPPNMRPVVCGARKRQPEDDDETAIVQARAPAGGNAEGGGLAALFSPSSFAFPTSGNEPQLGSRRTLGPRVVFQPIPVWLGAKPGTVPDDGEASDDKPARLAARPVRTKLLGRNVASGALPPAARAFTPVAGGNPAIGELDIVKAAPAPGSRASLQTHLDPKPSAEVKPKPGQIGGSGERRAKLGAIPAKPIARATSDDDGEPAPAAKRLALPAAARPSPDQASGTRTSATKTSATKSSATKSSAIKTSAVKPPAAKVRQPLQAKARPETAAQSE